MSANAASASPRRSSAMLWRYGAVAIVAMATAASASGLDGRAGDHVLTGFRVDDVSPGRLEALVREAIEGRMVASAPTSDAADARLEASAGERPEARARRAMR